MVRWLLLPNNRHDILFDSKALHAKSPPYPAYFRLLVKGFAHGTEVQLTRRADRLTPQPCSQKPVKHITHFSDVALMI